MLVLVSTARHINLFVIVIGLLSVIRMDLAFPSNEYVREMVGRNGHPQSDSYYKKRRELLAIESDRRIGHDIVLNKREEKVNGVIMSYKREEYNSSAKSGVFLPAWSFITAKQDINKSRVFQIIKKMPKGAVLHIHDYSMVNLDWIIANSTYRDHCYVAVKVNNTQIIFRFAQTTPPHIDGYKWSLVSDLRKKAASPAEFDKWLKSFMTMVVPDPATTYTNQNTIWEWFMKCLITVSGLVLYENFLPHYLHEAMMEALLDNVQYFEIRALLHGVYSLDGTIRNAEYAANIYRNASDKFVLEHPDFSGFKVIRTDIRHQETYEISKSLNETINLREKYPSFILGYDLVGQEDMGHPYLYYLQELLPHSSTLPYYFHAGETDWQDTDVDRNLVDAVLLNTTRIGHGYALLKHPEVMRLVKDKPIPIEVNPISNQVLGLVHDLRNHPMAALIAQDYPIVISSDDPSTWEADFLSHDFYVAFMALAGEDSDLTLLKKLAINSIQFSGMSEGEKKSALGLWQNKWNSFIDDISSN